MASNQTGADIFISTSNNAANETDMYFFDNNCLLKDELDEYLFKKMGRRRDLTLTTILCDNEAGEKSPNM